MKPNTPYLKLHTLLTGYRQYRLMEAAFDAGVFRTLTEHPQTPELICQKVGWDVSMGRRALSALAATGFLEETPEGISLSKMGASFFGPNAPHAMEKTLAFEKRLFDAWALLDETLKKGERVYAARQKSEAQYKKDLAQYIASMDEAARIRAAELWELFPVESAFGSFVELGFGSGAYTLAFLQKHSGWRAEIADLNDVVEIFKENKKEASAFPRIGTSCVNLLDETWHLPRCQKAEILLLSNLVHCQGEVETSGIIQRSAKLLAPKGRLIIHDFCRDHGEMGALYDLHMMLNTYNGKTYTVAETRAMMESSGLLFTGEIRLPSGSCAVVGQKP
ncbi:MAG: hypothetical protein MI742_03665 [Desulfobacterales bacterium]|nr:hypothetical protein [Desulfobacterales bacterium]